MRLSTLIKRARRQSGFSLRDLEAVSGISNPLISQIETGHVKNPSFAHVVELCICLSIPLETAARCVVKK